MIELGVMDVLQFSPDSRWLVSKNHGRAVYLWDLSEGRFGHRSQLGGESDRFQTIRFGPNGRWLFTTTDNGAVNVWDLSRSNDDFTHMVLKGHEDHVFRVAMSSDGQRLLTASRDNTIRSWDLGGEKSHKIDTILDGHDTRITSQKISDDQRWLATGSAGGGIVLWDMRSEPPGRHELAKRLGNAHFTHLLITPDNRWLVGTHHDGKVQRWDLKSQEPNKSRVDLRGQTEEVTSMKVSPNGKWLVTVSRDKIPKVWNLSLKDPNTPMIALPDLTGEFAYLSIHPNSRWLAIGSGNEVRVWDLTSPASSPMPINFEGFNINYVEFSSDGRWLVTGAKKKRSPESMIQLRELPISDPKKKMDLLVASASWPHKPAISPDANWLVISSRGSLSLWNLRAPDIKKSHFKLPFDQSVTELEFSPNSNWLVASGTDGKVVAWNLADGDPQSNSLVFWGYSSERVSSIAFSKDSDSLAVGYGKGVIWYWDLSAENPNTTGVRLAGRLDYVTHLAFLGESRITASSEDGTQRIWNLNVEDHINLARKVAGRNLTQDEWGAYFPPTERYRLTFPQLQRMSVGNE